MEFKYIVEPVDWQSLGQNPCAEKVLDMGRKMGYRNYISRIKKSDLPKMLLLSGEQQRDFIYEVTKRIYEIGSGYETPEGFKPIHNFTDQDREYMVVELDFIKQDREYMVVELDFIKQVIEQYGDKHIEYLEGLVMPDEEMTEELKDMIDFNERKIVEKHIENELRRWKKHKQGLIYNIDRSKDKIVNSWNFEHEIFELVRIYKTFDDENYYVIYEGG